MVGYVYLICSPTGRLYIGSTTRLDKRLKNYRNHNCKDQPKLYASFNKYGFKNHSFEILQECDSSILRKRELFFGLIYNVLHKDNLNCLLPKVGEVVNCLSQETRDLISRKLVGREVSEETRIKRSIAQTGELNHNYGKTASDETKLKMSKASKGKPKSDQMKARLKIAANNRSPEYRQKMSETKKLYWINKRKNEQQISLLLP